MSSRQSATARFKPDRDIPAAANIAQRHQILALVGERDDQTQLLRFYADRRNHQGVGVSPVYNDGGRMARKLLGECSGCDGLGLAKTGNRIMDQDGPYDELVTCLDCHGSGFAGANHAERGVRG